MQAVDREHVLHHRGAQIAHEASGQRKAEDGPLRNEA